MWAISGVLYDILDYGFHDTVQIRR